jgi:hypothetical protein
MQPLKLACDENIDFLQARTQRPISTRRFVSKLLSKLAEEKKTSDRLEAIDYVLGLLLDETGFLGKLFIVQV